MTPEVAKAIADSGPWAVVVFIGGVVIWALWRAHVTSDHDLRVDRNYWRDLALSGTDLGQRGLEIADKAMNVRKRSDG